MPAQLHATLTFDEATVADLVRSHVEAQGYFVEDLNLTDDLGYDVKVRPMTTEELMLHNLPTESLEDRLQLKIDTLVEDTSKTFDRFKTALEKQARDTERALETRLDDLRGLNAQMQESFLEIQQLAEQQAAAPKWAAEDARHAPLPPVPKNLDANRRPDTTPDIMQPAAAFRSAEVDAGSSLAPAPLSYETLSFADAAASLSADAQTSNPTNATRQKRFQLLHSELAREAAEAEAEEQREAIPGETEAFPSDLATQ